MAKLKLLNRKDELQENKVLGLSLRLGRLLPEHIAEMRSLFSSSGDPRSTIAIYAMRNCISELINDGEQLDPISISHNPSLTHEPDNRAFLTGVSALVIDAALVTDDVRKKLHSQPEPGGQTSAAPDAQANAAQASAEAPTSSSKV